MRPSTLTLRLVAASGLWVVGTLALAGFLLLLLFRDHIERRFDAALHDHLEELVAASEVGPDGAPQLSWRPSDPRFNRPHSGWYWQIEQGATRLHSASLWRSRLAIAPPAGEPMQELIGPAGERLRALVTSITLPELAEPLVYAIAGPVADIDRVVDEFATRLAATLGVLAAGLLGAVALQVRYGLSPLGRLRVALAGIRSGAAARLPDSYPGEVQPLVAELNALLDHNAALLERARTQTGNLAHALKNPLTVVQNEAALIEGRRGAILREQALAMARQIDWHLTRARAAGSHGVLGARAAVGDVARDLRFSLELLHRDRPLAIELTGLEILVFQGDPQDLEEMLGNLMDNACKWARGTVRVSGAQHDGRLQLAVEDDGPGIAAEAEAQALARGRRLDETRPGAGLGLAIVRNLAALYRGALTLGRSELGGLAVRLELPAAR